MVVHSRRWRFSGIFLQALCLMLLLTISGGTPIGVVVETDSDKHHSPEKVVQVLKTREIHRIRLFDVNPVTLKAFAYTRIEVMVGVQNEEVMDIGISSITAYNWVKDNIVPHIPATNIIAIAVGNEVITSDPGLSRHLVQACHNMYKALLYFRLEGQIKVSSPQSMLVIGNSFPPSHGRFKETYSLSVIQPLLNFLRRSNSFLMLNVYPFYFYESEKQDLDLNFALLQPNKGLYDPQTWLHYSNMFDALIDAVYAAMAALNYSDLGVVVTETGWPSRGLLTEKLVSLEYASIYNNNIIRHVLNRTGTPMKPGEEIITYIYEFFDENKRRGPLHQGYWNFFGYNGSQVYGSDMMDDSGQTTTQKMEQRTWCVGKPWVSPDALQLALDWACGPGGADCGPVQLAEPCYIPNTILSHASYAFNSYYQIHEHAFETCDFGGTATVTSEDPSYPGCSYPFRPGQVGAPVIESSMTGSQAQFGLLTSVIFVLLQLVFPFILNL